MGENCEKKPNILWICTDQQRYDTINCLGNPMLKTPNLDRLAKEGVAFTRTYCQSPVCTPSRASFLTGRYPRTTRAVQNGIEYFPTDEVLVTKMLADNGYDCGLVGKLHLSACQGIKERRPDDGYRLFRWSHHPQDDLPEGHDYQNWLKEKGVEWSKEYKGIHAAPNEIFYEGGIAAQHHQTTWCVEEGIKFFQTAEKPWLLSINIFDPHPPFDPPKEFAERFNAAEIKPPKWSEGELDNKPPFQMEDYGKGGQGGKGPCFSSSTMPEKKRMIADYYAMVELIDHEIGKLFEELEKSGQKENTIIIFHSDHGEMLGDHGLYWKGAYFYEELVHVPLIISWPSKFLNNIRSEALVELVDITPTILDAVGIEIPYYIQGKSLFPILTGKKPVDDHKDSVYCEYYNALLNVHDVYGTMYFNGRYKIVIFHGEEYGELYDLQNDPDESINLWFESGYRDLKYELLKKGFDKSVLILDPKPKRIRYY